MDAVVASNDGTAGGIVAALTAQRMAGIPVSGQDGDMAALNRVALGKTAGEIAVALASGTAMDAVAGAAKVTSPGATELNAVLPAPQPITKRQPEPGAGRGLDRQGRAVRRRDRRRRLRVI